MQVLDKIYESVAEFDFDTMDIVGPTDMDRKMSWNMPGVLEASLRYLGNVTADFSMLENGIAFMQSEVETMISEYIPSSCWQISAEYCALAYDDVLIETVSPMYPDAWFLGVSYALTYFLRQPNCDGAWEIIVKKMKKMADRVLMRVASARTLAIPVVVPSFVETSVPLPVSYSTLVQTCNRDGTNRALECVVMSPESKDKDKPVCMVPHGFLHNPCKILVMWGFGGGEMFTQLCVPLRDIPAVCASLKKKFRRICVSARTVNDFESLHRIYPGHRWGLCVRKDFFVSRAVAARGRLNGYNAFVISFVGDKEGDVNVPGLDKILAAYDWEPDMLRSILNYPSPIQFGKCPVESLQNIMPAALAAIYKEHMSYSNYAFLDTEGKQSDCRSVTDWSLVVVQWQKKSGTVVRSFRGDCVDTLLETLMEAKVQMCFVKGSTRELDILLSVRDSFSEWWDPRPSVRGHTLFGVWDTTAIIRAVWIKESGTHNALNGCIQNAILLCHALYGGVLPPIYHIMSAEDKVKYFETMTWFRMTRVDRVFLESERSVVDVSHKVYGDSPGYKNLLAVEYTRADFKFFPRPGLIGVKMVSQNYRKWGDALKLSFGARLTIHDVWDYCRSIVGLDGGGLRDAVPALWESICGSWEDTVDSSLYRRTAEGDVVWQKHRIQWCRPMHDTVYVPRDYGEHLYRILSLSDCNPHASASTGFAMW